MRRIRPILKVKKELSDYKVKVEIVNMFQYILQAITDCDLILLKEYYNTTPVIKSEMLELIDSLDWVTIIPYDYKKRHYFLNKKTKELIFEYNRIGDVITIINKEEFKNIYSVISIYSLQVHLDIYLLNIKNLYKQYLRNDIY